MAEKTVMIPTEWLAGLRDYRNINPNNKISVTHINNPVTENSSFMVSYGANFMACGLTGFDHQRLTELIYSAKNISSLKLKFNVSFGLGDQLIRIYYHNMTAPPPEQGYLYDNINSVYGIDHQVVGNGEKSIDITDSIQSLSSVAGFYFYPLDGGIANYFPHTIELTGEWIPQTATPITPIGGIKEDKTRDIRLRWTHNGAFAQSGFDLRYRVKGAENWVEISEETTNEYYDIPADTLEANEYEWQVRTKFETGEVGTWNLSNIFMSTEATNAPSIIYPTAGMVIPISYLSIAWQPIFRQDRFELEVLKDGVLLHSKNVDNDGGSAYSIPNFLENGQSYIVRLRTRAKDQFISDWAEVNISVAYTAPVKPILHITPNGENPSLEIIIENPTPTGTEPTAVNQHLFRRTKNENWLKLADLMPNSVYIDHTPASDTVYEYRVTVMADNDVSNTSDIFTGSVKIPFTVLSLANDLSKNIRLTRVRDRSGSSELNTTQKVFAGRKLPVTEFGETLQKELAIECLLYQDEYNLLMNLIESQETLLYRDARGRKKFVTVPSISINDEHLERYSVQIPFNQVYYKEGID